MSRGLPRLLTIESPFPEAHCLLHVLEPRDCCQDALWTRLWEGTYDKPFIVDTGLRRSLHFSFEGVQSAMDLLHPDRLTLAYTRRMMAFLLFNCEPSRLLLLGLGGGSLAKFCYRRLPAAVVTAVEVNSDVIALRNEFRIPEDDDRFGVVHRDGAEYVSELRDGQDVILADACDHIGTTADLNTLEFYRNARRCLTSAGILVINLCGDRQLRTGHMLKIRQAFGENVLTLPVRPDGNVIVFAFKESCPVVRCADLEARAPELQRRFELNFPRYVRRIALDMQLRKWERTLDVDVVLGH
jgi:spermidine synthase